MLRRLLKRSLAFPDKRFSNFANVMLPSELFMMRKKNNNPGSPLEGSKRDGAESHVDTLLILGCDCGVVEDLGHVLIVDGLESARLHRALDIRSRTKNNRKRWQAGRSQWRACCGFQRRETD